MWRRAHVRREPEHVRGDVEQRRGRGRGRGGRGRAARGRGGGGGAAAARAARGGAGAGGGAGGAARSRACGAFDAVESLGDAVEDGRRFDSMPGFVAFLSLIHI